VIAAEIEDDGRAVTSCPSSMLPRGRRAEFSRLRLATVATRISMGEDVPKLIRAEPFDG
jgi:hypothetical protein